MKIGIIAAMEEEISLLCDKLDSTDGLHTERFGFWTGTINGIEVGVTLCGIGKVNAAVGTTLLLERFKPDYLINTGVAGGFSKETAIGDIVISNEVRHYDADATPFDYEPGQIPQMPSSYTPDSLLADLANRACQACAVSGVHHGAILSGDSFIHTPEQIAYISERFPDAVAVEMEGAAIAQTGYLFNVPFILIRSISDMVHETNNSSTYADSLHRAATNSVNVVLHMLEHIH